MNRFCNSVFRRGQRLFIPLIMILFTAVLTSNFWGTTGWSIEERPPLSYTVWHMTELPLTLVLEKQPFIKSGELYQLKWRMKNVSETVIDCTLEFSALEPVFPIDESGRAEKKRVVRITVPANGECQGSFAYKVFEGAYAAHYPLRVKGVFEHGGKKREILAVRVIEILPSPTPKTEFKRTVIQNGGVSLLDKSYTASFQIKGKDRIELGQNWHGIEPESRTTLNRENINIEGQPRNAFTIHPPYLPKGGNLFQEFPISLLGKTEFTLSYGCCMRRHSAEETPSDGVTFRFWVCLPNEKPELIDEYHVTSYPWVDRIVSLKKYSGKEFILRVETSPGPKNDTNCDSCCLNGLLINPARTETERNVLESSHKYIFNLNNGHKAIVQPGKYGIIDAKITLKNDKAQITYNGIQLAIGTQRLDDPSTSFIGVPEYRWDEQTAKLVCRLNVLVEDKIIPVTMVIYSLAGMLVIELPEDNPEKIGQLMMKEVDVEPKRLYYGHGYVLEKPTKDFIAEGGGFNLSTSHIGFDFVNGLSLLMASTIPPTSFHISPSRKTYSLEVSGYTKLGLLPSDHSAFAAAIEYRKTSPWVGKPASGVVRKRGRLVFDVWGDSSANLIKKMNTIFKYGVTDSLFFQHAWQRWGYDVRLPDIWAPNSQNVVSGSLEDLRKLAELCAEYKVPFGLHDNYIDYYPDADQFTYDSIVFHETGIPCKAWINPGVEAQSYRWRPDRFMPFLENNMKWGNYYLPTMDAYFVDVFASKNIFDFYSREGTFFPRTVTLNYWKKSFEIIDRYLSHKGTDGKIQSGITASESGHDFLIGSLDGADAQWSELVNIGRDHSIYAPCERWSRTPWFTAVNHTNFSRHGAGYSVRYEAMRSRDAHGILSDDYISSEILGGVDFMVDLHSLYPGSIIKHYLGQHVVRRLADKEIESVTFTKDAGGQEDITRQTVTWSDGTKVFVNRSENDWTIGQWTLPMFGYVVFDKKGELLSAIVRNPEYQEDVVEISQRPDSFYINGRGYSKTSTLQIEPKLANFIDLGNGKFKVLVDWNCTGPAPKDLAIFLHIFSRGSNYHKGWFAGGERPELGTSRWGTVAGNEDFRIVRSGKDQILTVPDSVEDGTYSILVGLYDSQGGGERYRLIGSETEESRYVIAELEIKRENGKIVLKQKPFEKLISWDHPNILPRLLPNKKPVAWHGIETTGAVSVQANGNVWKILPIPVMEHFSITIREKELCRHVIKVLSDGKEIPIHRENGQLFFSVTAKDAKEYQVHFQ